MNLKHPEKASKFLKVHRQFQLGHLQTEASHPDTVQLSELANTDIGKAIEALKKAELKALQKLLPYWEEFEQLRKNIRKTLNNNGKIFLCGCGATGRLALSLEYLWRNLHRNQTYENQVVSFMAGGDYALVRSIEGFEDMEGYGERQLDDLNFSPKDLFIGCSEGGETAFVISATQRASTLSSSSPVFIYCNPDSLIQSIERCNKVLINKKVLKISLDIGPMSLSGSTRLQACTVMMLAVGNTLLGWNSEISLKENFETFIHHFSNADFQRLSPFCKAETDIYRNNGFLLYRTDEFGITLLTDTTERAPTFSLTPFENSNETSPKASLCYLSLDGCPTAEAAWLCLLGRPPRPLEWGELNGLGNLKSLMGFDFSENNIEKRRKVTGEKEHPIFRITRQGKELVFTLLDHEVFFGIKGLDALQTHVFLKTLLNFHSNVVMGRMGRFQSNIMTWVKPSNYKLIDRTIRYSQLLIQNQHMNPVPYEKLARLLFEIMDKTSANESLVLKLVKKAQGIPPKK